MEFPRANFRLTMSTPKALVLVLVITSALLVVSATGSAVLEIPGIAEGESSQVQPLERQSAGGRFLLNSGFSYQWGRNYCGSGRAPYYNCKRQYPYPRFRNAQCCTSSRGNYRVCMDVGGDDNARCGSCTSRCRFGYNCCGGGCVNLQTDRNNCGRCRNQCRSGVRCRRGMCGY